MNALTRNRAGAALAVVVAAVLAVSAGVIAHARSGPVTRDRTLTFAAAPVGDDCPTTATCVQRPVRPEVLAAFRRAFPQAAVAASAATVDDATGTRYSEFLVATEPFDVSVELTIRCVDGARTMPSRAAHSVFVQSGSTAYYAVGADGCGAALVVLQRPATSSYDTAYEAFVRLPVLELTR